MRGAVGPIVFHATAVSPGPVDRAPEPALEVRLYDYRDRQTTVGVGPASEALSQLRRWSPKAWDLWSKEGVTTHRFGRQITFHGRRVPRYLVTIGQPSNTNHESRQP